MHPARSGARPAYLSRNEADVRHEELVRLSAADHVEVKSVRSVTVRESQTKTATLLFDPGHSWNERILAEQFRY